MPTRFHCVWDRDVVVVVGFLTSLPAAVATVTGFVFGDTDVFAIPIHPRRPEMRNLPTPLPEATTNQTDEACLKRLRVGKAGASF